MAELPERLRFGECPRCAYAASGTPELCFECAGTVIDQVRGRRCATCDGALGDDLTCANPMCSWPVEQRAWGFVNAIAQRSGVLQSVINDYKYEGRRGWAWIFARLLVGYLGENFTPGDDHGVIVAAPTYVGPGGRTWDHIGLVLERAAIEDRRWPFAPGAVVKTGPSAKMVGMDWRQRAHASTYELPRLLAVPDASVVAGKRVLVYDDVFTSGNTLRAIARTLLAAGAVSVDAVVLARQPFRS